MTASTFNLAASSSLLAQDGFVAAQLARLIQDLLTPEGILAFALATAFVFAMLLTQRGFEFMMATVIFLLSTMIQLDRQTGFLVPLWGPLESIRNYSRPACVVLLSLAALRAISLPTSPRPLTGSTAVMLYTFQMYYGLQMMFFSDWVKGSLGIFTITLMFVNAALGFGKLMQSADGARRCIGCFAWAAVPFAVCNFLQIAFGYSTAVQGGRLVGIAGNAQQMATICSYFMLSTCLMFRLDSGASSSRRWMWAALIGIIGVFQLWTGSRTGLLASGLGLMVMFRLQIGRLAMLALVAGAAGLAITLLFEDSTANLSRYVEGGDTRTAVFEQAIDDFLEAPILGQLPFSRDGAISGVESTWLRALAALGIVGGLLVVLPFGSMLLKAVEARRLDPGSGPTHDLTDFYLGATTALMVTNTFEGMAFGVLTLPVLFLYTVFTLAAYLCDGSRRGSGDEEFAPAEWETQPKAAVS
jgi:hypothetical protein